MMPILILPFLLTISLQSSMLLPQNNCLQLIKTNSQLSFCLQSNDPSDAQSCLNHFCQRCCNTKSCLTECHKQYRNPLNEQTCLQVSQNIQQNCNDHACAQELCQQCCFGDEKCVQVCLQGVRAHHCGEKDCQSCCKGLVTCQEVCAREKLSIQEEIQDTSLQQKEQIQLQDKNSGVVDADKLFQTQVGLLQVVNQVFGGKEQGCESLCEERGCTDKCQEMMKKEGGNSRMLKTLQKVIELKQNENIDKAASFEVEKAKTIQEQIIEANQILITLNKRHLDLQTKLFDIQKLKTYT